MSHLYRVTPFSFLPNSSKSAWGPQSASAAHELLTRLLLPGKLWTGWVVMELSLWPREPVLPQKGAENVLVIAHFTKPIKKWLVPQTAQPNQRWAPHLWDRTPNTHISIISMWLLNAQKGLRNLAVWPHIFHLWKWNVCDHFSKLPQEYLPISFPHKRFPWDFPLLQKPFPTLAAPTGGSEAAATFIIWTAWGGAKSVLPCRESTGVDSINDQGKRLLWYLCEKPAPSQLPHCKSAKTFLGIKSGLVVLTSLPNCSC